MRGFHGYHTFGWNAENFFLFEFRYLGRNAPWKHKTLRMKRCEFSFINGFYLYEIMKLKKHKRTKELNWVTIGIAQFVNRRPVPPPVPGFDPGAPVYNNSAPR